ncbi:hypothetical protein BS78_05G094900, partial [Paspalum vaginatum]
MDQRPRKRPDRCRMDWPRKRRRRPSPWSDLPSELCGLILRCLRCHIDRLRFRCERALLPPALPLVCTAGDHSFLSVPGGDLRRFSGELVDALHLRGVFSRPAACFDGWLMYWRHDSSYIRCTGLLVNPVSGAAMELPLRLADGAQIDTYPLRKLIVRSSPPEPDLFAAIFVVFQSCSVTFYCPGAPSWSSRAPLPSDGCGRTPYVDIAFYHGKLYALTADDGLFILAEASAGTAAPTAPHHVVIERAINAATINRENKVLTTRQYLVVSRASSSKDTSGIKVEVFEADLSVGRWTEVSSLDSGEALFVRRGYSKANCVYVLGHDLFGHCYYDMPSYGFCDLRSGEFSARRENLRIISYEHLMIDEERNKVASTVEVETYYVKYINCMCS